MLDIIFKDAFGILSQCVKSFVGLAPSVKESYLSKLEEKQAVTVILSAISCHTAL
jgi:hypothetical protein